MSALVEREAIAAVWRAKRLWALHVGGNLLLVVLAYGWLAIPDARLWQPVLSVLLGFVLALAFLWLHGSTFVFFAQAHPGNAASVRGAFRATLRRLPALVVWAVLFALVLWVLDWAGGWVRYAADWLGSLLTMTLRTPVSPQGVAGVLKAVLWVLAWVWAPVRLLPLAVEISVDGFRGFGGASRAAAQRVFRRGRYWLGYIVLMVLGLWLPTVLIDWIPQVESLWGQAISLLLRFVAAYLLLVTAWLLLASLLARHRTAD
ncbi:MAG: hypothetical protein L0212_01295 [Acidobacteria bacterium]|nr:hypothetical protein [Acidobacteriota bacterium]